MAKVKKVGFNFFKVVTKLENGEYEPLDISGILEHYRREYIRNIPERQKIVYEYQREPARVTGISIDENGFYHIWFERLLNYQLPIKTTLHGESEIIEIEETEFVGHEVSALFDPIESVLMVQRNRDSLGPTAIGELLNSLVIETGAAANAYMILIEDREARQRGLRQAAYRKINVKVSGASATNLWSRITGNQDTTGVDNIELIVSTDRRRDSEIEEGLSRQILTHYVDNPDTGKLKVHGRYEENDPVEPIDLIKQKLVVFTTLDYEEQRNYSAIAIYERMLGLYLGNEDEIGARHQIQRMR
ncbi:DUF6731 family protein [Planococcus sp. X10-3]|uniref:DUF6731 family protein n=1 Tax=Planococcus sp. X10-3 TaxID=3061240 RepID=UPI003BB09062